MASLTEFKTWPKHQRLYFEITSSALCFWVKSRSKVMVGLAKTPSEECSYEIIIDRQKCIMKTNKDVIVSTETPTIDDDDFLSGNKFRKFWIAWKNNGIVLGTEHTVLLLGKRFTVKNLKYITFYVSDDTRHSAEWRCYLPPVIENLAFKKIEGAELHWVRLDSHQIPEGALIGGFEREYLYIIRAPFRGSLTPGKFVPSLGLGFISWGGNSHVCGALEILCGNNCIWVPSHSAQVPEGALEAGYTEVHNETMYVGRVNHMGHLIVGKIAPSHRCCYFAYENRELNAKNFEVLVVPNPKIKVSRIQSKDDIDFEDSDGDISESNIIDFN